MLAQILGMPHVADYASRAVKYTAGMCRVASWAPTCIPRVVQSRAVGADRHLNHEMSNAKFSSATTRFKSAWNIATRYSELEPFAVNMLGPNS